MGECSDVVAVRDCCVDVLDSIPDRSRERKAIRGPRGPRGCRGCQAGIRTCSLSKDKLAVSSGGFKLYIGFGGSVVVKAILLF